jgi:hypothetical protein
MVLVEPHGPDGNFDALQKTSALACFSVLCDRHGVLRIGNCSGFYGDRLSAMREMLEGGDLDVLTGDYLAELTMLILGKDRRADPEAGYARTFLTQLRDCLALALERRVRIVANAGGVNPAGLVTAVRALGLPARVATVRGDDLTPRAAGLGLGRPLGAHAYLGAFGIARALESGADVVVTGRVTDASLVIGAAINHFGWGREDYDRLAGATVAGHVLECGTQATGGNYAFFTEIEDLLHPGFPIAEINDDGSSIITKHPGTGGAVTVGTVTAQIVYEIQDARYAGPDVTTRLDSISLRQAGPDRVAVEGVRGEAPPPDLKVSLTSVGGFRNEMTVVLTGLDIPAKAELFQRQFEAALPARPASLTWSLSRLDTPDAPTEQQASALLTVVARDPDERTAGRAFANAAVEVALGSYPGFFSTTPPGRAHPYGVFTAGYVRQTEVPHEVLLDDGTVERIPPPRTCRPLRPLLGPAAPPAAGGRGAERGGVRRVPLGSVAGARSGDKGGDANIGLWVRGDAAYRWLSETVSAQWVWELLPETAGKRLSIVRLPAIRAVNIVVEGLLGEGVAFNARFDPQAKGLGEWLRARLVDVPETVLEEKL